MSTAYERQRKSYEALQRTVASLADTLEKAMPDLAEPSSVTRTRDGGITIVTGRVSNACYQKHSLKKWIPFRHCLKRSLHRIWLSC